MPPVQNLKTALLSGITKAPSQILKECCMSLGYLFVMECSIVPILSFVERIFAVPIGYGSFSYQFISTIIYYHLDIKFVITDWHS